MMDSNLKKMTMMTAKEARNLMKEMDSLTLSVRKTIDEKIRSDAIGGMKNTIVYVYKSHPAEKVQRSLIRDGFSVSCKHRCDQRDGDIYTYYIGWAE